MLSFFKRWIIDRNTILNKRIALKIIIVIWLILLLGNVVLSITSPKFLFQFGQFLVHESMPVDTEIDAIVVYGGGENTERVEVAIDLLLAGQCDKLILSGGITRIGADSWAKRMEAYAKSRGVHSSMILLDEKASSTYENAVNTVALAKEHGWETIYIVTSSYHTRRSLWISNKVANSEGVDINWYMKGSQPPLFDMNSWWEDEEGKKFILNEFIRYLGYRIKYLFV